MVRNILFDWSCDNTLCEGDLMNKSYYKHRAGSLIGAIVSVIVGILLVIFHNEAPEMIIRVLGIAVLTAGVVALITYFVDKSNAYLSVVGLVLGIILIVLGIWMVASPSSIMSVISIFFGIVLIVDGIIDIQISSSSTDTKSKGFIISLILGIITLIAGIIIIIFYKPIVTGFAILFGVLLIFEGVSDIVIIAIASNNKKREDKKENIYYEEVEK